MTPMSIAAPQSNPRRTADVKHTRDSHFLFIDNLRTTLISLVILLHLAITYGAEGDWYYRESGEALGIMYVVMMIVEAIGGAFVLGLFLLLAGYFTPRSYDRKGFGPFLLDRLKRLLVPLVFYELLIFPSIRYGVRVVEGYQGTFMEHLQEHFNTLNTIANGPVWFLMTLILFSIFYAVFRHITRSVSPKPISLPPNWKLAAFALLLGLVTFVVRLFLPVGVFYEPLHQEFARYPQYIAMFILGILAYRGDWFTIFPETRIRQWRWVMWACLAVLPAIVIAAGALTGELDERGAGGWNWISFSYSLWEGFSCLAFSITVLGWFRKHWDRTSWLAGRMADATFTAYIIHPAIIVPLALILSPIKMNLDLKFLLVSPLGIALTYIVSYYFKRLPLIRNIL